MSPLVAPAPHPLSYRLYDELIGSAHGQTDHTILAFGPQQTVLGYLLYSVFDGRPAIHCIRVHRPYQRQGLGTAMVTYLQAQFPDLPIDWGWTTEAGQALQTHVAHLQSHSVSGPCPALPSCA